MKKKTVHALIYRFFWKGLCFKYLIYLIQLFGSNAGLFEGNLLWVRHYDPPTLNLHIGRRTNLILIEPNIILKQPV